MRVRRLEISGFKSFADRTVIDFPQRMCAVVGPNGCGKSNVVDAIRWVLGEQSAKQLRGQAMEDVIFNGSSKRSPLGLAEVSLVFENNSALSHPQFADLPEIMITRRLYRSGDSDYLINKIPCRLKDIQQLLMDTGLGNRAYAIIEQGRVAAFIDAKPEDRRLWLEEAAGITRYKSQKKISLRKLDAVQVNLERLQDILLEVETQMNRAKRQAKQAQRYQELRDRIRELDLQSASFAYAGLREETSLVAAEEDAIGAQLLLANQRMTGLETDLETLKVQLVTAEQEIALAGQRQLQTQGDIQKAENDLTLLGQKAEDQKRLKSRYQQEREEQQAKLAEAERQMARAGRIKEQAQARLSQSQEETQKATDALAECQQEISTLERRLDQQKQSLVDHLSHASQLRNRLTDMDRYLSELARRKQTLDGREQALNEEIARLGLEAEGAEKSLGETSQELAEIQERLSELDEYRRQAATRLAELTRAEQEAIRRQHQLAAQADALALSLSSHEWVQTEVRQVLNAAAKGELDITVLGVVAEHLTVAPGRELLVEAALGSWLQAVVVKDGESARRLAAWVEEAGLGRLGIVALDDLKAQAQDVPQGCLPLGQMAQPQEGFAPLGALLAGVGSSPGWEAGWQAARSMSPGQAVVTEAGHHISLPGAAQAGNRKKNSVLARQNELIALKQKAIAAEEEQARAAADRKQAEAELEGFEEEIRLHTTSLREKERAQGDKKQAAFRLQETQRLKERELEGLKVDAQEVLTEDQRLCVEKQRLDQELGQIQGKRQDLEQDLEKAQQDLAAGRQSLEQARQNESEARLALASLASEAEHAAQEANRLTQEIRLASERLATLNAEIQAADEAVASLTLRREEEQNRLGALYEKLDQQQEEHRRAREILSQAQMRVADLEAALKQARAEQREVESHSQETSLRRRELELKQDNLCEKIMERCRVDLTSDFQNYLPEGAFDPDASQERLDKLRQRLNRLGPVNMEAIAEYEALSERHNFLSGQKQDLEASVEDLRQAIRKINKSSRARFNETFQLVNQKLAQVFPVLFGGGQAQLVLDENVDPLDAGLHLMVELPGKKLRNLESLSGGEKAMAACAVLFALFLIRPAPFCFLDEVDAPLDEANVVRFHNLLRQLSDHSQIMMVTHTRQTMEVMDQLYGVTMEEKGVSKILSVTLEQGEAMAA